MDVLLFLFQIPYSIFSWLPMPWRAIAVIFSTTFLSVFLLLKVIPWFFSNLRKNSRSINSLGLSSIIIYSLMKLFLYPCYLTAKYFRNRQLSPLRFVYAADGLIYSTGSAFIAICESVELAATTCVIVTASFLGKRMAVVRSLAVGIFLFVSGAWFIRPQLNENEYTSFFDKTLVYWYSIESQTGKKIPLLKSSTPQNFIKEYFSVVNSQFYIIGWDSLTQRFKVKTGMYRKYLDWWEGEVGHVEIQGIALKENNKSSATVDVAMKFFKRNGKKSSQKIRCYLVWDQQSNKWLIDDTIDI